MSVTSAGHYRSFTVALMALLLSCGQGADAPVYDTSANPNNFPPAALQLLDYIESNQVVEFDSITTRFADLYTSHTDLLDNKDWRQTIGRLGFRLEYKADSIASLGLSHFAQAAGLYRLASFARPSDPGIQQTAAIFAMWQQKTSQLLLAEILERLEKELTVSSGLELIRSYWSNDSVAQMFIYEYLVDQLFANFQYTDSAVAADYRELSAVDRAMAASLELIQFPDKRILARFNPGIELAAAKLSTLDSNRYLLECYFLPHQKLSSDYLLVTRIQTLNKSADRPHFIIHEAVPYPPATNWIPGKVLPVFFEFVSDSQVIGVAIGLRQPGVSGVTFATLDDGSLYFPLPQSSLLAH